MGDQTVYWDRKRPSGGSCVETDFDKWGLSVLSWLARHRAVPQHSPGPTLTSAKKKKINLAANEIEPRSAGETRVRLGQPRDQQEERTVGVRPV